MAVGICQYFYLGMGYWLLSVLPPWWSWQCFGPPFLLCWNCPEIIHDQWCYDGHGWVTEPSCVPWMSLQMFCLIPQYIPHHSQPCNTWICRSLHSFAGHYLCHWGAPGGPWWCCLLWNTFHPMFYADVFATLTHALNVWYHYVRLVVTACLICVFAGPLINSSLLLFNAGLG